MANPVLVFEHWNIRDDAADLNTDSGWYTTDDSRFTLSSASTVVRVRGTIAETGGKSNSATMSWQYRYNSGTWTTITSSTQTVRKVDLRLTEGAGCTSQLLTSGTGTFGADGLYGETADQTLNYTKNEFNEIEDALSLTTLGGTWSTGDLLELRPVDSTGFMTYSSLVTIDIYKPVVPQTYNRTLSDDLTLTENQSRDVVATRNLTDSLTLTENFSRDVDVIRLLADSFTLTDSPTAGQYTRYRSLLDPLSLTENLTRTITSAPQPSPPTYGLWRRAGRM